MRGYPFQDREEQMEITADEVELAVRDWSLAFGRGDLNRWLSFEAGSIGFGVRTAAARDLRGAAMQRYEEMMRGWAGSLRSYSWEFDKLDTAVASGVGLAWGVYVEEIVGADGKREVVRARFSMSMAKDGDGWHMLLFHRDAQPFDEKGRALPGAFDG